MIKELTFSLGRKLPIPGVQYGMISPFVSITYSFPESDEAQANIKNEVSTAWAALSKKLDDACLLEIAKCKLREE